MNEMLEALYREHRQIAKVLTLLRHQARLIQAGEAADNVLLEDAMHYIRHYPDVVHHPHEEILFEVLLERAPELRKTINDIQTQHREMLEASETLHNLVQGMERGAMMPRDRLVDAALSYVETNFDHMRLEESTVFPGAEDTLTDKDWETIRERLSSIEDPLFGPIVEQRYAALLKAILDESD